MGHAILLCACYAVMCFGGRWIMKDRKPFDLRMCVLACSCSCLCFMSSQAWLSLFSSFSSVRSRSGTSSSRPLASSAASARCRSCLTRSTSAACTTRCARRRRRTTATARSGSGSRSSSSPRCVFLTRSSCCCLEPSLTRAHVSLQVPELVDTLFIVLRKKPLIFLHWYHHITVLLFCWHAFATLSARYALALSCIGALECDA